MCVELGSEVEMGMAGVVWWERNYENVVYDPV